MNSHKIAAFLSVLLFLVGFSGLVFADCVQTSIACNATNNDTWPCLSANETFNYTYNFIDCSEPMSLGELTAGSPLTVSPSSPQTYPISNIWFNISIGASDIDQVWINHNFSGALANYTMSNTTQSDYYYNLDFVPAAGNYEYIFYTNLTNGSEYYVGSSEKRIYVIEKSATWINLTLNGDEESKSFVLNDIVNFTASLNIPGQNITLESNYPSWENVTDNASTSYLNNTVNLSESGYYFVRAYWEGNENYTSAETIYYFDTTNPQYEIVFPASTQEYNLNGTYWFNISIISATVDDIVFGFMNSSVSDFTTYNSTQVQNNGNTYYINLSDLPAENYTYYWCINRSSTQDITNCSGNVSFNVTKKTPSVNMYVSPSWSVEQGISTTVNCSIINADSLRTISLYRNDAIVNGGSDYAFETSVLSEGTWSYSCRMIETENYTSYEYLHDLAVTSGTFVSNNGGADTSGDTTTTVQGQFTLSSSESTITMDAGNSKVLSFSLINTYENDINVTSITVSGIEESWYALDKTTISRLKDGTTEKVKMTLNVPADTVADNYTINVKAVGKNLFSGASLTRQTTVSLTVNSDVVAKTVDANEEIVEENSELEVLSSDEGGFEWALPTGLLSMSSEYFPYMVLMLGIVMAVIVFMKRDMLTQNLIKISGTKSKKNSKSGLKDIKKILSKNLPKMNKNKPVKKIEMKEQRVKDLETEIEKDIKELQNIMEAEKKVNKNRK